VGVEWINLPQVAASCELGDESFLKMRGISRLEEEVLAFQK
jgi:hypothetical protein